MNFLFGSRKTPAERLREHQRALNKAQRELDRERGRLEAQERRLMADIRNSAKAGQMGACKVMAKDLVRTRKYIQKFYQMRTQLQGVGLRIQAMRSNQQMAEAMKGASRVMKSMNHSMNLPALQRIMQEFEMESEAMDMKEEMMSDAVDDVMMDEEDEEEEDLIVRQVLDEMGIQLDQQLADTPTGLKTAATGMATESKPERVAVAAGGPSADNNDMSADDAALQARLDNLRRD
ncbi:Snf7-domain-containing protein [Syncephalis pseudoplumigaleata]|uniref:Snf7-domain-containing protein n=1 Tax=Syncephalis pseudoplumigaleata TaxID=1712513 RepID=A0A4P9Z7A3_9FUNG|nr:Snf7-domain-containing protein [Syncephalis pseudoplumigaleata]|eukprot:RKP28072.1 Snf7-domain-containing protein [Syncephalis pseudoplumigaleata]